MATFEELIAQLGDDDTFTREQAARLLGKLGDVRAVNLLIGALNDAKYRVCESAADALAQIGEPCVESLITSLSDPNVGVRIRAAIVLGRIQDVRAVEPLIAALQDARIGVRMRSAHALGRIGDVDAVKPLIALLQEVNSDIRTSAARALTQIGTPEALAAVEAWRTSQDSPPISSDD